MRKLREIWDDPNTWRSVMSEGFDETCGCCLFEIVFMVALALFLSLRQ